MQTISRTLLAAATNAACQRFRSHGLSLRRQGYGKMERHVPRRRNRSMNLFGSEIKPLGDTTGSLTMGGANGSPMIEIDERHNRETGRGKMYMVVTFMRWHRASSEYKQQYVVGIHIAYNRSGSALGIAVANVTGRGRNVINAKTPVVNPPVGCHSATDVVEAMPDEIPLVDKRPFTKFEASLVTEAVMILADVDGERSMQLPTVTVARLDGDTLTLTPPDSVPPGEIRGGSIQNALPPDWSEFNLIQAKAGDEAPRRYTSWYTVLAAQRDGGDMRIYAVRPMETRGAFSDLAV